MRRDVLVVLASLVALGGCLGENRRPEERQPIRATEEKRSTPALYVYREIGNPPSAQTTIRLVIDADGRAEVVHGTAQVQDPVTPDEKKALDALAAAIAWDKLPIEYPVVEGKGAPKDPLTYEVTNAALEPARTVTTHDGNDKEDESFKKFRVRLRELARRVEAMGH